MLVGVTDHQRTTVFAKPAYRNAMTPVVAACAFATVILPVRALEVALT